MEVKLEAQFNIMEVTSELQVAYMVPVQAITNNFNLGNFNIQVTYQDLDNFVAAFKFQDIFRIKDNFMTQVTYLIFL